MATTIVFAAFGVPALVFQRPDTAGFDYDHYTRALPDGLVKSFFSQRGRAYYNAFDDCVSFCLSLAICLSIDALLGAPRNAYSDALWVFYLLVVALRYAHTSILRTWHTNGRAALGCLVLACAVQALVVLFAAVVAFVLVSSPLIGTVTALCVLPVLAGFAVQFAGTVYMTNATRTSLHLYSVPTTSQSHSDLIDAPLDEQAIRV